MSLASALNKLLEQLNDPDISIVDIVLEQEEVTRPPEEFQRLIQYLIPRDALFATFLLKCRFIKGHPEVRTCAVNVREGKVNFYYNEEFTKKFPPNQLMFIVAHEFYHIVRLHLDRPARRGLNHDLYNISADMIINEDILDKLKVVAGLNLEMPAEDGKPIALRIDKGYAKANADRKLWTTEGLYKFLEKTQSSQKPPSKKEVMKVGTIVRIGADDNFGVVTKVNKDGTYEVDPLTAAEVEKRLKNY